MSKVHVLNAWPGPFEAVRAGRKAFEYRLNDRDFQVGDCLVLQEYNPETGSLTRECLSMRVVYIDAGGQFGIPPKYCVMSVEPWDLPTKGFNPMRVDVSRDDRATHYCMHCGLVMKATEELFCRDRDGDLCEAKKCKPLMDLHKSHPRVVRARKAWIKSGCRHRPECLKFEEHMRRLADPSGSPALKEVIP